GGPASASSVGLRSRGSLRSRSQFAGCQTIKLQSTSAITFLAGSRLGLSQKLCPKPLCTTTRLFFTSSLANSSSTALIVLASPRHSACHWPPPNGGPSHHATRPV